MRREVAVAWRTVGAAVASAVAFSALAILAYWLYFAYFADVYERFPNYMNRPPEGLVPLQVLFYVTFAAHMAASVGAAVVITRWARAPAHPTYTVIVVVFAILLLLLVYVLSAANACVVYVSFPIPGFHCDD